MVSFGFFFFFFRSSIVLKGTNEKKERELLSFLSRFSLAPAGTPLMLIMRMRAGPACANLSARRGEFEKGGRVSFSSMTPTWLDVAFFGNLAIRNR